MCMGWVPEWCIGEQIVESPIFPLDIAEALLAAYQ